MKNEVTLIGTVLNEPKFLFKNDSNEFYQFTLAVYRKSEAVDYIPVISIYKDLKVNDRIKIIGIYQSYNKLVNDKNKLILTVYASSIEPTEQAEDVNDVYLEGVICKQPIIRNTPLGRKIADVFIAISRPSSKRCDYLPLILWGRNADKMNTLKIGDTIEVWGRVQSRIYMKEDKEHTAYEVSVGKLRF